MNSYTISKIRGTDNSSTMVEIVNNNPNVDPAECDENAEKPSDEVMDRILNWPAHGDPYIRTRFLLSSLL